jgi:PKD repeat protein
VEDANKCIGEVTRPVVIPNALLPDFSVSRPCVDQQTGFLDITNDAADPVASRLWSIVGIGSGTANPQPFTFADPGNYNVRLDVNTQNGCTYVVAKNVLVTVAPQAGFMSSPSFGAPPLSVQFTNTSSLASAYLWQFGDEQNSTSTLASPVFTFTALGDYGVTLTASSAQGCLSSITRTIEVVIPVYDVALSGLELLPATTGGSRPVVMIHNRSNVPVVNLPVRFDLPGNITIRDFVNAILLPGETYRFTASFELPSISTLGYVCAEAELPDAEFDDNQVCVLLEQPLVVFEPYPNPVGAGQDFVLQWISVDQADAMISILNAMGQVITKVTLTSQSGLNTYRVDPGTWDSGVYLIRFRQNTTQTTFRVVRAGE